MLRGVGLRVLGLILLFSSVVTLTATAIQLYLDFDQDVDSLSVRLDDVGRSSLGALAADLWNVDPTGLHRQLEDMLHLPDMRYLEVRESAPKGMQPLRVAVGTAGSSGVLVREFGLVHVTHGVSHPVGTLLVEASLDGVYARLWDRVLVILAAQGLKTFLVSLFTLYIVHRLITRHLIFISDHFERRMHGQPTGRLVLQRGRQEQPDELDQMVRAFQDMADGLEAANAGLAQANRALKQDIGEGERREKTLQAALDELAAANRELERFAYVASHDLQEPLRSIVSFTQLLSRNYGSKLGEEGDEYIAFIVAAGQRMHALINDLLAYSRVEQKGGPFEAVVLEQVLGVARQNLNAAIQESGAEIDVGPLPCVNGDRTQLVQLFQNLLGNAMKFRVPGKAPRVSVSARAEGDLWVVTVKDDGIGLETGGDDPFEVFRRQHTVHAYPGTGIGLAICKRIVARHGGRIWVESEPGQGAAFHFSLPGTPVAYSRSLDAIES
jgi:signal transduction histidine kinase